MRTLHSRFTIRSLLILVAVVGLNLAGAIISCGNLQKLNPALVDDGLHVRPPQETDADGNTVFDLGKLDTGERLVRRVQRLPPQLATLEIWSPVVACVSITVLVLAAPIALSRSRHGSELTTVDGPGCARLPSHWLAILRATIAVALVGLNIAGAASRQIMDPTEQRQARFQRFDQLTFFDGRGGFFFTRHDGRLVKREIDYKTARPAKLSDFPLAAREGNSKDCVAETIVCQPDGSIVAYDGSPGLLGRILTQPRVLQPSARSFLETSWPVVCSTSITLLVFGILWRQARRQRSERVTESVEPIGRRPDSTADIGQPGLSK